MDCGQVWAAVVGMLKWERFSNHVHSISLFIVLPVIHQVGKYSKFTCFGKVHCSLFRRLREMLPSPVDQFWFEPNRRLKHWKTSKTGKNLPSHAKYMQKIFGQQEPHKARRLGNLLEDATDESKTKKPRRLARGVALAGKKPFDAENCNRKIKVRNCNSQSGLF